jgi:hypothetical protein
VSRDSGWRCDFAGAHNVHAGYMSIREIPTFPYQQVEPDASGCAIIDRAPFVDASRVFFMLFTSEEFQNCPQNFGCVSLESRSLLTCFHAMASVAISHADNVYTRIESFSNRPASNVIFRTFEHPSQRGNFAILMQVRTMSTDSCNCCRLGVNWCRAQSY